MANDLTRSKILFPFTPSSSVYREQVKGINDCFMVIPAEGLSGSPAGPHEYSVYLYSMDVGAPSVTYVFRASAPAGILNITFVVTRDEGVKRVDTTTLGIHAVLIVDTDNMYEAAGIYSFTDPYAEIEPAKIVWRTDRLTKISFYNAYRNWNPQDRNDPPSVSLVKQISGGELRFKSGYNVSLQYDESTQTLYVRGIPGAGEGYPPSIPWDEPPPAAAESYIRTINGFTGSVAMSGSTNVHISQDGSNGVDIKVLDPIEED